MKRRITHLEATDDFEMRDEHIGTLFNLSSPATRDLIFRVRQEILPNPSIAFEDSQHEIQEAWVPAYIHARHSPKILLGSNARAVYKQNLKFQAGP